MQQKIIIIGLTPQGLSLLRTLGRAGLDVVAFYNGRRNVGRSSRYGVKILFDSIDKLKKGIEDVIQDVDYKPLCYITSGEMLAWILREYKELYGICNVIAGPYHVVEELAHKDLMYKRAICKGFRVAKFVTLDKYKDGDLKFPVFLKRNYEIPLFFKAEKIENKEMLHRYISRIKNDDLKDVIAQEFINITPNNIIEISAQIYCSRGMPKGFLIGDQKRRLKKGLTSYFEELGESSLKKTIRKLCSDFLEGTDYTGFIEFEFMYDKSSNELYFIETNTRTCGLQSSLVHKFSNVAEVVTHPYDAPELMEKCSHVRWMNITRDIRARLEKKTLANILDIFRSKYDILDMKDVKPFFSQFL